MAMAAAAVVGACSIHPLPVSIGADKTVHIAQRIRCEARAAVKANFLAVFNRPDAPSSTRQIAARLADETLSFAALSYAALDPVSRSHVTRYDGKGVAYDFTFDLTESGGLGGNLDLLRPLGGGTLGLGISASADLTRQNRRNFQLNDTFASLLRKLDQKSCARTERGDNWLYPISGSIGLAEMIETFVELNDTGSLAKADGQTSPTLADTLQFTTALSLSAKPNLVLTAAGRRWQTTAANAGDGISVGRTDLNQVIVAFSAEIPAKTTAAAPGRARTGRTPAARTPSEINASTAVQGQKQQLFFDNTRNLNRALGLPNY